MYIYVLLDVIFINQPSTLFELYVRFFNNVINNIKYTRSSSFTICAKLDEIPPLFVLYIINIARYPTKNAKFLLPWNILVKNAMINPKNAA